MKGAVGQTRRVGIDAGSKTIKLVVLDDSGSIVHSAYRRHRSNIRDTLRSLLHDAIWMHGDVRAQVSVTGSAGISVAKLLGLPFVQEVVATTEAVRRTIPDADAVVELGGEDAKVVYLTGGVEQRMNATCAGGTGGFIDTIAFMLGVRTSEMSRLALGAQRTYPIASRCAVFAQTDVRPLLNEGASKADIAASALDAVVRQTLGGLACGRPLQGKVVFLGGPLQHIPELVSRFRKALNLDQRNGVKPADAHLYPALGAALSAAPDENPVLLTQLEEQLANAPEELDAEGLPRLAPLFTTDAERDAFRARHAQAVYPTARAFEAEGPLYLGVDAGPTTVKLALLDADGSLLHSDYRPSRGDALETIREMLLSVYRALPKSALKGHALPYLAHVTATGYGEELLTRGFGADSGVVETTAHVRAARQVCPEATFVLDIGGQDMKALWLDGAHVRDAVLNEACSSGCGAFIEGTAHALHSSPSSFAAAALEAEAPVDLGTRCTVFMSSRVKHAQKTGATVADIAAGAAYSVVQNALFRIIGAERVAAMGKRVVVQGGTFKSDAVLRAFELTAGVEAIRPDRAHLMGAIGAALVARSRAQEAGGTPVSGVATAEELEALQPQRRVQACEGCANACRLTVLDLGAGRQIVSGNRCERWRLPESEGAERPEGSSSGEMRVSGASKGASQAGALPNLIAHEQELIAALPSAPAADARRADVRVGVLAGLETYRFAPFWHGFVRALGFTPLMPGSTADAQLRARAWETVPAEGACYPAKLVHAKTFALKEAGADAILFPQAGRNNHCAVASGYAHALRDSVAWLREGTVPLLAPVLSSVRPGALVESAADAELLAHALEPLCAQAGCPLEPDEVTCALEAAFAAHERYETELAACTDEALAALEAVPDARGILLVGRPYHVDPEVMHGVDQMLGQLGFTVFGMTGLTHADMPDVQKGRSKLHIGIENERWKTDPMCNLGRPFCTSTSPSPMCNLGRPFCTSASHANRRAGGLPEWRPAKRLLQAARFVVQHPQLELVCLQSFGCGYDAASLEEVRELLEAHGRPFTALKMDEMVETAHIRIRLRTLAESLEARRSEGIAQAKGPHVPKEAADLGAQTADEDTPCRVRLLDEPLDERDLACARRSTVKDACFSANVLAARAIRVLEEQPEVAELVVPEACAACLNEAVARMAERATGRTPRFVWERGAGAVGATDSPELAEAVLAEEGRPKIGVIGNPLLVFSPFMNDGVVQLLEEMGCEAVLPEEEALYTDDVQYLDQLERFAAAGVKHVIYLQSFGCVKGHVHARGSHYTFRERFPDMPVTVLDYDPEASALNRENRIRLIAETVLARMCRRDVPNCT